MRGRRAERGQALVMALGVLTVLLVATVSLLMYSSATVHDVRYDNARQKASAAAEAGLNEAISILTQAAADGGDVRDPSALPPGSDTVGGGTTSWSATVDGDTWTISATGTVKNPSGAADVERTVTSQFRIGVDGTGWAPAWQYVYTDSTTDCTTLQNSAQISAPFFINGNLCLKNSADPTADDITVKGHISLENSAMIGSPSQPIANLHTTGCGGKDGPFSLANCTPAYNVYATNVDSTFENVAKPTVDLAYWYAYSKPGPKNNCTSGSFPPGFDGNSVMDLSMQDVQLLPATGYSCTFTSGSSTIGKIVWAPGSPGTLQISGVIFIDGNIVLDNTDQAIYSGRGTIYASGTVELKNSAYLCAATGCDPDLWDGTANMLTLVAGSCKKFTDQVCTEYDDNSFVAQDSSEFQGGVYSANDTTQQNSALIEGPTISRQLYLKNSAVAHAWPPIDFVSYGVPAPIGSTTLVPVTGSFSG